MPVGALEPQVVVLGAGICGLSCAVALGESGVRVMVVADRPPEATVSAVAGALWFPYGVEGTPHDLARARASYDRLEAAAGVPGAGVTMVDYLHRSDRDPWWKRAMPDGRVRPAPGGFLARVPLARSPQHLAHLRERAAALGARFENARVDGLGELFARAPVAVNCAGLGARGLAGDAALRGVRGQVVHLRPDANADVPCVADADGPGPPAYVLPRGDVVVAGGTAEPTRAQAATPDRATRAAILARCEALVPALAGAEVVGDGAGVRPVRDGGPRVEAEDLPGGRVIHDYGHGGAGWTLAWGCALEVVAAVRAAGVAVAVA